MTSCAKLKPHLRVQCRQLLGPLPEEAAEFWKNPDGSRPKNAPPEEPKRTKEEEPLVLPMSPEGHGIMGIHPGAWAHFAAPVLFLTGTRDYGQGPAVRGVAARGVRSNQNGG